MFAAETKAAEVPPVTLAPGAEADCFWKQLVDPIGPFLGQVADQLGEQVQAFDPEIAAFAQYALSNQGKQLRPALVALSGSATGQIHPAHVTVAVIIEMVHLATLVHDDVMDEAEIRRRRPTVAANWGNEISVLLGDCLFAHALKLAASFPTSEICRAVSSATTTVCSGEILQTLRRHSFQFSRADYFKVLEMKTAELFALSCDLGGCLSGAAQSERAALRRYGLAFGTAYQIYDDCLDLLGSEALAGKSLGTDLATGKLTLPVLIVHERAGPAERARLQNWINDWQPRWLPHVRELLERFDALAEAQRVIQQYIASGRKTLGTLPDSDSRCSLLGLLEFLAQQTGSLRVCSS
jgi:octaprenyl-diphosphate synthase